MNSLLQKLFIFITLVILISCNKDEPEFTLNNEITTEHYGIIPIYYYSSNPLHDPRIKPVGEENIVWNDKYPIQIASTGNAGIDNNFNPYLGTGITLQEYDSTKADYSLCLRYLNIDLPFSPEDFRTQESFYGLIHEGSYRFASTEDNLGRFTIRYKDGTKMYSSFNVDNSSFQIQITNVEQMKPEFSSEPNGNNGLPASVKATLTFSCLLEDLSGEFIYIKDAEVRGRFYRRAPIGNYWDDWGKGWNE